MKTKTKKDRKPSQIVQALVDAMGAHPARGVYSTSEEQWKGLKRAVVEMIDQGCKFTKNDIERIGQGSELNDDKLPNYAKFPAYKQLSDLLNEVYEFGPEGGVVTNRPPSHGRHEAGAGLYGTKGNGKLFTSEFKVTKIGGHNNEGYITVSVTPEVSKRNYMDTCAAENWLHSVYVGPIEIASWIADALNEKLKK